MYRIWLHPFKPSKRSRKWRGTGCDISDQALKVAKENAKRLDVPGVCLVHSDLFSEITGNYDMIVSNPPYIPTEEIEKLQAEVRLFESHDCAGWKGGRSLLLSKNNQGKYQIFKAGEEDCCSRSDMIRAKQWQDLWKRPDIAR